MACNGTSAALEKQVVRDSAYIENINWAFIGVLDSEHDMFGKEFVFEDGRITEVHSQFKIIRREDQVVVTTKEVSDMVEKLHDVSDGFCQLAMATSDSDFALKTWYNQAANSFRKAELSVKECLHYCPKFHASEVKEDEGV